MNLLGWIFNTTGYRLESLAEQGCVLNTQDLYLIPARFRIEGKKLAWVNAFPRDQHDVHVLDFDHLQVYHDRDVAVVRDKEIVAYIAPLNEWAGTPGERAVDEYANWITYLKDGENRDHFNRFADDQLTSILQT